MGWSKSGIVWARILMAINYFFCGFIGFIVLQSIASREMKKYGVRTGFLGAKKQDVASMIARLRSEESIPIPPPPAE
jgi:hypothetical protein